MILSGCQVWLNIKILNTIQAINSIEITTEAETYVSGNVSSGVSGCSFPLLSSTLVASVAVSRCCFGLSPMFKLESASCTGCKDSILVSGMTGSTEVFGSICCFVSSKWFVDERITILQSSNITEKSYINTLSILTGKIFNIQEVSEIERKR